MKTAFPTVGILGGGQLGRMLALAGYPLGLQFRFFDPNPESPAAHLAPLTVADYTNREALSNFARSVDIVTFEFENVPKNALEVIGQICPVFPNGRALEIAQDRMQEKTLASGLGIPTPRFRPVSSKTDLLRAVDELGTPSVLKTTRLGYDGKGQFVLKKPSDLEAAWAALGSSALVLEEFVSFSREVSQILVRSQSGEIRFYPLCENEHREGILHSALAPAPAASDLSLLAEQYGKRIADELNYTGVLALEFFVVGKELLFNEMAPRVHNSGHWTIEGSNTSQFENHLRAVMNLPLGDTTARGTALMFNLIGTTPKLTALADIAGLHIHLYAKTAKPGRKLGHVTLMAERQGDIAAKRELIGSLLQS